MSIHGQKTALKGRRTLFLVRSFHDAPRQRHDIHLRWRHQKVWAKSWI